MSKIKEAFSKGKAFIPFITCGDPTIAVTEELVLAMAEAGADLIELGIPFSDPTAEGVVIQDANIRALKNHITTDDVFALVSRLRNEHGLTLPICFMTYANVVYSYGAERFIQTCAEIGVDGLILPDIPFEEKGEFLPICKKYGDKVDLVSFIAPTSKERIEMIAKEAEGFIYCISSLGVTGTRSEITTDIGAMGDLVRKSNPDVPVAVGFGISNAETAAKMAKYADGVIVGSAIVKLCAQYGADCVPYVKAFVRELKQATGHEN